MLKRSAFEGNSLLPEDICDFPITSLGLNEQVTRLGLKLYQSPEEFLLPEKKNN